MHDNSITLQEAIDGVIKCQHENGHPDSYIKNFRGFIKKCGQI